MRVPKYRHFKARNRGFVEYKGKRRYFPGEYGSDGSLAAYRQFLIAIHCTAYDPPAAAKSSPLIAELAADYLDYLQQHYASGNRSHYANQRRVVNRIVSKYGSLLASEFRPHILRELQRDMAANGKSRTYINDTCSRVKTWFKWCVSHELIEPSIWHGLQSVPGVRRSPHVKESPKRKPVEWRDIEPVFEHLQPAVAAMLWLQWFTGARSSSVCQAKPEQFTHEGGLLLWRPRHKTEHTGRELVLPIGPRCHEKIAAYLKRAPGRYMFSPREGDRGTSRLYGQRYKAWTYRQSIRRAQDAAIRKATKESAYVPQKWTPHQIRRARGTIVRGIFGLEGAQSTLGHERLETTQIYAERQLELAKRIAREIG